MNMPTPSLYKNQPRFSTHQHVLFQVQSLEEGKLAKFTRHGPTKLIPVQC